MISKIAAVAWRDFKHTVLTKAFLFGAVGVPILMVGVIGLLIPLMKPKPRPLKGTLAMVDPEGRMADAVRLELSRERMAANDGDDDLERLIAAASGEELDQTGVRIDLEVSADPAGVAALKDRVREGALLGAVLFTPAAQQLPDGAADATPAYELFVGTDIEPRHLRLIERRLGRAVTRVRVEDADLGLDIDEALALVEPPRAVTSRLLADGGEAEEGDAARIAQEVIPIVFMMLIWGATFASAQHLMMSTIEEKSNKVVEVLLSAVSPLQLMTGKILGQAMVGLIILTMYSALGLVALVMLALMHLVPIMHIVYLLIFFTMAYLMIASIMAGVGSAVTEIREANSLITPAMLVLFIPLMLWPAIKEDPNGAVATVFSFVPPAIPFVMVLRVTSPEAVPTWQIPVSILWGSISVAALIWMAAKIFRVGVLMYGKPPSPLELLKWIRYS